MITSFLIDEVKTFLKFEPSIINSGGNPLAQKNREISVFPNLLINKIHTYYGPIIPVGYLSNEQTSRKHKHSLYPYLHIKGTGLGNSEERQSGTDKIKQKLLLHLNKV